MKKIAFICGPPLGHVGRLHKIFSRLKASTPVEVTLIVPRDGKYAHAVFGKDCKIIVVPTPGDYKDTGAEVFADALEQVFNETRFDLVVQDVGAFNWLPLVAFPDCPRAVVTNVFITRLAVSEGRDMMHMRERETDINQKREQRGLPHLGSIFDLYEADRVLLADPLPIVREFGQLPPSYVACGAVSWAFEGQLPPELEDKNDLLLMSMGTTGRVKFNANQIENTRVRSGCAHSVYVGNQFEKMRDGGVAQFQYEWLPLEEVLEKTKIVVSQGGTGSSYQALSKGVPVIALPKHSNQQILGEILEKLGVGVCVARDSRLGRRLNAVDFEALTRHAKRFAEDVAHEDGAGKMAREIEGLL